MNRLANLILLNFISVSLGYAQSNYNMIIHQAEGNKIVYPAESIDSITFIEKDTPPGDNKNSKISFAKIYGESNSYCAFTSLIKRGNVYYLAFREGKNHVSSDDYGIIRILKSTDLDNWEIYYTIKKDNVDLRDPCLSILPGGSILLICGARIINGSGVFETKTYYSKEWDNRFSDIAPAVLPDLLHSRVVSWIWRLTWNNNIGYGCCYHCDDGDFYLSLLSTTDGSNYNFVCDFEIPGSPSETIIRFLEDNTMIALTRNDNGPDSFGWIGRSIPPYTDWYWYRLPIYLAGHDFLIDNDKLIVCSRTKYNIAERTCLFLGDFYREFRWNYMFPQRIQGGDTGYAGMIDNGDEYIISYHSKTDESTCSVYLARFPKKALPRN